MKRILTFTLLAWLIAAQAWADYALVTKVSAGSTNGNTFTTGSIDTSGADLIVVGVCDIVAVASTLTDSKSNTWTPLTKQSTGAADETQLYYAKAATVGTGHTFTLTCTLCYGSIVVASFSGSHLTAPSDQENGATGAGVTVLSTGSVTPSQNDELLVTAIGRDQDNAALAINSGFTIQENVNYGVGAHYGCALATLIQTTAGAVNPQWSWTTSAIVSSPIATFKEAAAGRRPIQPIMFP